MKQRKSSLVLCRVGLLLALVLGTALCAAQTAQSQSKGSSERFPSRPVRLVITHKAGGITDLPARIVQPYFEKYLGATVIIENMDGAGGNIARSFVYKQPADGYTLLVTVQPSLSSGAIVSDGDLMEGVSSEAASLAGHLRLGNLIYLYDNNHITIEGNTKLAFTEDRCKRFEAYGWHAQEVDG